MIVELSTGYIGTGTQLPAVRRNASASMREGATPGPAQFLARDTQGLVQAGRLAVGMASASGATRGINAARDLFAVAEAGVTSISAVLAEMKVLAEAAAGDAVSSADRAILDAAFGALRDEVAIIVGRTTYGDVTLLDGDGGAARSFSFTLGVSGSSRATAEISIAAATSAGLAAGLESADLRSEAAAGAAETLVDTAIEAAAGLANVLRAAAARADAAAEVNAHAAAGSATVSDGLLEFRSVTDERRQTAREVSADAGLVLAPSSVAARDGAAVAELIGSLAVPASAERKATDEKVPAARAGDGNPSPVPESAGGRVDITA